MIYDNLKGLPNVKLVEWGDRILVTEDKEEEPKFKKVILLASRPSAVQAAISDIYARFGVVDPRLAVTPANATTAKAAEVDQYDMSMSSDDNSYSQLAPEVNLGPEVLPPPPPKSRK